MDDSFSETDPHAHFAQGLQTLLHDLHAVQPGSINDRETNARFWELVQQVQQLPISYAHELAAHEPAAAALVEAAERADNPTWIACARLIYGSLRLIGTGLSAALLLLKGAVEAAQKTDSQPLQYETQRSYSFYLAGENLAESEAGLLRAHALGQQLVDSLTGEDRAAIIKAQAELENKVGIIKFDRWDYAEARGWLERSYSALGVTSGASVNYLAQLQIGLGAFEEAEALLRPSLDLTAFDHGAIYDLALLGKLYLEWERPAEAEPLLRKSWELAKVTGAAWMLTLVGNYTAELFLDSTYSAFDLDQAEAIARDVQTVATESGWNRSRVQALSLRVRAALAKGENERALALSQEMIDFFERFGILPALRSEEIYYVHAQALAANGLPESAEYVTRARGIVSEKYGRINDAEASKRFLDRIPLNRWIGGGPGD